MSSLFVKGIVRNGRVELTEPIDLPDGTAVPVTSEESVANDGPMSPEEIARIHTAMQTLLPLDIPEDVAKELDAWDKKLNQYGSEHRSRH